MLLPQHYASILKSCITRKAVEPGKQIHARLCLTAAVPHNLNVATQLVNLYSLCRSLKYAHHLFDEIPKTNVTLWNILIRAYAWNGPHEAAISLYRDLLHGGLAKPDKFTFPCVLKACSALSAAGAGREIHDQVRKMGLETDVFVGAALIDMYGKCGCVDDSRRVFDKIPNIDVVLWNSMLAAYSQNGKPESCLKLCKEMVATRNFRPTESTLVTAISASADCSTSIGQGRELHGYSWRVGFDSNNKVKTGLVDMYAKTGNLKTARVLFDLLTERRVASWNAIITGYAMHGLAREALDLFRRMVEEARPDHITFVGVLSACNRGGLLEEGRKYFHSMVTEHCIEPAVQHYTCMVDLLGHFNELDEAHGLILKMTETPDCGVWGALLNACKMHGNVELGELALERLIELEPEDAGNYVILSNMYAQAGRWEGVGKIRKSMAERKVKKQVGCSWVEVKNETHAFVCGDISHPMWSRIRDELVELEELLAGAGYVANTLPVFYDVESDEKREMVRWHSERLAIALGLMSSPAGSKLLVTKNIRVCEDCHEVMKIISRLKGREITVRDVNRYHRFKNGVCSCGDYW